MKKLILSAAIVLAILPAFSQQRIGRVKTKADLLNEKYCTGLFNTPEGTYFDMVNDYASTSASGYINILDWLQGRVAGLQIYVLRNNTRLPIIRNSLAGVFVDEMQRDPEFLNCLPVTDIAMIKVIKGPFLGGVNSPGGAIAIYTKDGGDEDDEE